MANKVDDVDLKVDQVLAKVEKAADEAVMELERASEHLVQSLDMTRDFARTIIASGDRLRSKLSTTNNPPLDLVEK